MGAFTLFGLEPNFLIDTTNLQKRYRDLQTAHHPDRYVNAPDAEKRDAIEQATQINEAYAELKDPVRRAMHMLSLQNIDGLDANDTSMPRDFLVEQIEWRESIADATMKEDAERLEAMLTELNGVLESLGNTFSYAYEGTHYGVATTLARKMRFTQKLIEEVDSAMADLEQ
jgi:molecular chaperone HscB